MMKLLLLIPLCCLAACTMQTAVQGDVYLSADTDPQATACGGYVNDKRIPDVPVSASECVIHANDYVKNGSNTWTACNSAPELGEACIASPFTFKLSGKP